MTEEQRAALKTLLVMYQEHAVIMNHADEDLQNAVCELVRAFKRFTGRKRGFLRLGGYAYSLSPNDVTEASPEEVQDRRAEPMFDLDEEE